MLSQRAASVNLQRSFYLQQPLPLLQSPPRVPLLPLTVNRTRLPFTRVPFCPLTNSTRRANHTLSSVKLAGHKEGPFAPPPPSRTSSSDKPKSHFQPSPSSSRTFSTTKIAAQRSAQIARHLSGSAKKSTDKNLGPSANVPESIPTMASPFTVRKVAAPNTLEHRVYIEKDGVPVSPFHDIPLFADAEKGILNMVVEIPRWTNAKLEVGLTALGLSYFQKFQLTSSSIDLQRRAPQPHQARHQEGQASLRP
jgi:hypothetical protein